MNSTEFDRLEAARLAPEDLAIKILGNGPDAQAVQEQAAHIQALLIVKSRVLKETEDEYFSDESRRKVLFNDLKKSPKILNQECRYSPLAKFFSKEAVQEARSSVDSRADIKDPAVPDYSVILSRLLDKDLAQGVLCIQLGLRINNLLKDQSLDYSTEEVNQEFDSRSLSDARNKLNELLDKRKTSDFPSTLEQQEPFARASKAMIDEGIDLIAKKYPEAAAKLRGFPKPPTSASLEQADVTFPQESPHRIWRKVADSLTRHGSKLVEQAPQLVTGIALGAAVRIAFSAAAVAITGPSLAVLIASGALAGGIVGVWRTRWNLPAERKAPGYKAKAFVVGAAFGAIGGFIGAGVVSSIVGLIGDSTVVASNPASALPVAGPSMLQKAIASAMTSNTIEVLPAAAPVGAQEAMAAGSTASAPAVLTETELMDLLNSSPNTRCGVNGWGCNVVRDAMKSRLSGWWGGVFLNDGVPAGVEITRNGIREKVFFSGSQTLESVLGGPR